MSFQYGDFTLLTNLNGRIQYVNLTNFEVGFGASSSAKGKLQEVILKSIMEDKEDLEAFLRLGDKPYWFRGKRSSCSVDLYKKITGKAKKGYVFVFNEVSRLRYQQRQLDELEAKNKALAFNLAHKVRGPISTTRALVNMQREADLGDSKEILERIEKVLGDVDQEISHLFAYSAKGPLPQALDEANGKRWICVVDDDEDWLNQLAYMLNDINPFLMVKSFTNAGDALLYLSNTFDIVFMTLVDFHMPGFSGQAFIEILKENKIQAGKILMVTADSPEYVQEQLGKESIDKTCILTKPLNIKTLTDIAYDTI